MPPLCLLIGVFMCYHVSFTVGVEYVYNICITPMKSAYTDSSILV